MNNAFKQMQNKFAVKFGALSRKKPKQVRVCIFVRFVKDYFSNVKKIREIVSNVVL